MGFQFVLRAFLADVIRLAIIILLVVAAIMVGIGLFAVGAPLVIVLVLVLLLMLLGFYVEPRERRFGRNFSFIWK